jgi:hypothetical protein
MAIGRAKGHALFSRPRFGRQFAHIIRRFSLAEVSLADAKRSASMKPTRITPSVCFGQPEGGDKVGIACGLRHGCVTRSADNKNPDRHDRALGQTLARFSEAQVTLAIGSGTTYAAMGWGLNQTQL